MMMTKELSFAHRKRVGYAKLEMLQHYVQDRVYRNAATVLDRERRNAWGQTHKENLDRFNNVDFSIVNNTRVYQQKQNNYKIDEDQSFFIDWVVSQNREQQCL